MALSIEAAEALVTGYLNGRLLPPAVHKALVLAARARLTDGDVSVLDETLCSVIDRGADEPMPPDRAGAGPSLGLERPALMISSSSLPAGTSLFWDRWQPFASGV